MRRTWTVLAALFWLACSQPSTNVNGSDGQGSEAPSASRATGWVELKLIDENVSDTPLKTQIEQHFVVTEIPSARALEAEILDRFAAAASRRGFDHHEMATNIYIYVYGSEEQARAGQGLWIGMISKGPATPGTPKVRIDPGRLEALSSPSEEKLGLTEEQRRSAFREIAAAESRATDEAIARVPNSQIMKQVEVERELAQRYKQEIAHEYGLSEDQLLEISVEGVTKGWPYR